jgi:hypothetical protein
MYMTTQGPSSTIAAVLTKFMLATCQGHSCTLQLELQRLGDRSEQALIVLEKLITDFATYSGFY